MDGLRYTKNSFYVGAVMEKQLERLRYLASVVLLLWLVSVAAANTNPIRITDGHPFHLDSDVLLSDPEQVIRWLRENKDKIDYKLAKRRFDDGFRAVNRKSFSPAMKDFGESAILYPAPETLVRYSDVFLQFISRIRKRNNDFSQIKRDLSLAVALYKSARAVNGELKTLDKEQVSALDADISCTEDFLSKTSDASAPKSIGQSTACRPLQLYALK
jgi:hypothetical protein